MDTVQQELYSLVLTEKDGIFLNEIEAEYRSLTGTNLVFDRTKFRNVESFILSMPDYLEIKNKDNYKIVYPIVSKKIASIKRLIDNQKASTKRKPKTSHYAKGPSNYRFGQINKSRFTNSSSYYDNRRNNDTRGFERRSNDTNFKSRFSSNYDNSRLTRRPRRFGSPSPLRNRSRRYGSPSPVKYKSTRESKRYDSPSPQRNRSRRYDSPSPHRNISKRYDSPSPDKIKPTRESKRYDSPSPHRNRSKRYDSPSSDKNKSTRRSRRYDSPSPNKNKPTRESKRYDSPSYEKNRSSKSVESTNYSKNFNKKKEDEKKIDKKKEDEKIDYKSKLVEYLDKKQIENGQFIFTPHTFKNKIKGYFSKLVIGDKSWLTFPLGFKSMTAAENYLAKIALASLEKDENEGKIVETCDDFIESFIKLFKEDDSFFSNHLKEKYLETYNKNLPEAWLEQIKRLEKFDVQEHQIGNKTIQTISLKKNHDSIIIPFKNLNIKKDAKPEGKLQRKNLDEMEVIILRVTNNNDVVLRLKKDSSELEKLIFDLHKYYIEENKGDKVKEIILNKDYAAVFSDAVFRVKPLLLEGQKSMCWFQDDGVYEKISLENLREINKKFLKLPFQAFFAKLSGLEILKNTPKIKNILDEKINNCKDYLSLIAKSTCEEPLEVSLYDISDENLKVNLNEKILESLKETQLGSQLTIPKAELPNYENNKFEVIISVPVNPQNFIVIDAINYKEDSKFYKFNKNMQNFYNTEENIDLNITMIYQGLFVCINEPDGIWYRSRVEDVSYGQNPKITCYLVDLGKVVLTDLDKVQPLFSQFTELPMIAHRASLIDLAPVSSDWDPITTFEFSKLVDNNKFKCEISNHIVIDQEYYLRVSLYEINSNNNLCKTLVDKNIAKFIS